eukprot:jgi/Bigna1/78294/fgenesh1_pg.53_\
MARVSKIFNLASESGKYWYEMCVRRWPSTSKLLPLGSSTQASYKRYFRSRHCESVRNPRSTFTESLEQYSLLVDLIDRKTGNSLLSKSYRLKRCILILLGFLSVPLDESFELFSLDASHSRLVDRIRLKVALLRTTDMKTAAIVDSCSKECFAMMEEDWCYEQRLCTLPGRMSAFPLESDDEIISLQVRVSTEAQMTMVTRRRQVGEAAVMDAQETLNTKVPQQVGYRIRLGGARVGFVVGVNAWDNANVVDIREGGELAHFLHLASLKWC